MKLIQATVLKTPREVTTKYGQRSVLTCLTRDGKEVTVWRPGGDREVLGRCVNERVMLAIDSKGKVSLIEHGGSLLSKGNGNSILPSTTPSNLPVSSNGNGKLPSTTPSNLSQQTQSQSNGNGSRAPEIRDYTERLAKLYAHCFKTVKAEMNGTDLPIEAIKDISTSVFIQTTKKFNL